MRITERLSATGATAQEIASIECRIGGRLPDDYRDFLATVNGGRPSPRCFEFECVGRPGEDVVIQMFFTTARSGRSYAIDHECDVFSDRVPKGLLPIAGDCFGNIILLDVAAKSPGAVYFWDHEREDDEPDEPTWDNISFVAASFTDFVNLLHD